MDKAKQAVNRSGGEQTPSPPPGKAETPEKGTLGAVAVAVHEAGHAVTAWAFGFRLETVTLPGDPLKGRGPHCLFHGGGEVTPEGIRGRIAANLGGRVATEAFLNDPRGGGEDLRETFEAMKALFTDPLTGDLFRFFHDPEPDPEAFFRQFSGEARAFMEDPRSRRAVEALAGILERRGTMNGFEAARILEMAWGDPLPEKAKPAAEHLRVDGTMTFEGLVEKCKAYLGLVFRELAKGQGEFTEEENGRVDKLKARVMNILFTLD